MMKTTKNRHIGTLYGRSSGIADVMAITPATIETATVRTYPTISEPAATRP